MKITRACAKQRNVEEHGTTTRGDTTSGISSRSQLLLLSSLVGRGTNDLVHELVHFKFNREALLTLEPSAQALALVLILRLASRPL